VQPRTDLEIQAAHLPYDRISAADAACRPVEGRQEPVTGGVDLTAAEPGELLTDQGVVAVEEIAPPSVAQRGRPLRGPDDVREHDCGQDPIGLGTAACTRDELLDLVEDCVGVADPREVIGPGQLHVLRALNAFSHVSSPRHAARSIALALNDDRRDLNGGKRLPRVVSKCICSNALIPDGLTARRSKRAHDRRNASSWAELGAKMSALTEPVPHAPSTYSANRVNASTGMPIG
jgi:hypothetical protein